MKKSSQISKTSFKKYEFFWKKSKIEKNRKTFSKSKKSKNKKEKNGKIQIIKKKKNGKNVRRNVEKKFAKKRKK